MSKPYNEYTPSEDTYLLCDYIEELSGESALEIGGGSGYVSKVLERNFKRVVCTEISFHILCNQTYPVTNPVCCNAADAIHGQFDAILSNPPYLDTEVIRFPDTDGGPGGIAIPGMFMCSAAPLLKPGGQLAMITSSLSRYDQLLNLARSLGLHAEIAMKKKLFFEELYVLRAYR